jgi:enoyl-CoA hydratase/carnithine racemase
MSDPVLIDVQENVATVTLNGPHNRNALTKEMAEGLRDTVSAINANADIRCVILTGAKGAFCAGGDLSDMRSLIERDVRPYDVANHYKNSIQIPPRTLHDLAVPSIAAVNGVAIGAGCDMALMCDMRIASEAAVFAESFAHVGLVSGDGGAWFLPRVVGLAKAYELTFTGDKIDAAEALRLGMVSQVVAADGLADAAQALAQKIARHPAHALRMSKRLLRDSLEVSLSTSLEMAAMMQAMAQSTPSHRMVVMPSADKDRSG